MPSATLPTRAPRDQASTSTTTPAPAPQRPYTAFPPPASPPAPQAPLQPRPDHYDNHPLVAPHFSRTPPLTPVERVYTAYGHPSQAATWGHLAARMRRCVKALYAKHGLTECHRLGLYISGSEADVQDPGSERMMILVLELVEGEVGRWREVEGEVWAVLGEVVEELRGVCVRFYRCWDAAGGMGMRGVARRVERPPQGGDWVMPPSVVQAPADAQVLRALDGPEERARFFGPYRGDEDGGESTEDEVESNEGQTNSSPSEAGEGSTNEEPEDALISATVAAQPLQRRTRNSDPYPFLTVPIASSSGRTNTRPMHAARDEFLDRSGFSHARQRPATRQESSSANRTVDVFDALRETLEMDVRAGEAAARLERAARAERRMRELGRGV